ncbi:hypothetical protein OH76DRAFT_1029193 [Lentinus brumalis]|uniref:Uncharacterized protein n=1 Tax=Lentinus brumalis TaxID=2498619 RepID=A0A371CXA3_9APHY|nr:hypothetical protein OH76DRAFT_1029193 [Polyporus brumalis]
MLGKASGVDSPRAVLDEGCADLKPPGRNGGLRSPGSLPGRSSTVLMLCWECVEDAESWDDGGGWKEGSGRGRHFLMKDRRRARHCAPHIGHIGCSSECKQATTFAKVLAPKDNCKTGRRRATNAEQKTRKWRTGGRVARAGHLTETPRRNHRKEGQPPPPPSTSCVFPNYPHFLHKHPPVCSRRAGAPAAARSTSLVRVRLHLLVENGNPTVT